MMASDELITNKEAFFERRGVLVLRHLRERKDTRQPEKLDGPY